MRSAAEGMPAQDYGSTVGVRLMSSTTRTRPGASDGSRRKPSDSASCMHSHSFWHLYFVLTGRGASVIGGDRITWSTGDSFYVPAWMEHDLQNLSDDEDAIVHSVQNLPEQAFSGSLMRKEAGGGYVHIASDGAFD